MSKVRTTLTINEGVLRAVRALAARTGRSDSEVIEEAVRKDLGHDLLGRLCAAADVTEGGALALALEAQHATRPAR